MLVEYSLKIDLGGFMDREYSRRILSEKLFINDKEVFIRIESLAVDLPGVIKNYVNKSIKRKTPKMLAIAECSLNSTELFLNNGFKSIFAGELAELILEWFQYGFMVVYRADIVRAMRRYADSSENTIYVEKTLNDAAKAFGINSNALGYKALHDGDDVVLCSIFEKKENCHTGRVV